MTLESLFFVIFALLACVSALGVVIATSVVRMAFWLVLSLGAVAALFFLLDADFLGATQLLIYVGGTVVLLVFGVMLTASGPYLQLKTSPTELVMGAGVSLSLLFVLGYSVIQLDWQHDVIDKIGSTSASRNLPGTIEPGVFAVDRQTGGSGRPLGLALLGLRPDRVDFMGKSDRAGYLLPFEIISVHLLAVLVGAAYLARAKRRMATRDEAT